MLDRRLLEVATPDEIALIEQTLEMEKALTGPLALGEYIGEVTPFAHTMVIDAYLTALVEWRLYKSGIGPVAVLGPDGLRRHPNTDELAIRKLQISSPARHGKSLMTSVYLPAWHMMRWPDRPFLMISNSDSFASRWSKHIQDVIAAVPEFGFKLDHGMSSIMTWRFAGHKGELHSAGVGGQLTGHGGFGIVCDDLTKNEADAQSTAIQDTLVSTWDSAIVNRLTPDIATREPGFIVLMGTRFAVNDLQGVLREREPDDWVILNLPGIAYTATNSDGVSIDPDTNMPDPLGRRPGEPLCPEIKSLAQFEMEKRSNPRVFAAMVQGRPFLEGGELVSYFPEYELVNDCFTLKLSNGGMQTGLLGNCIRFAVLDLAATKKTYSDYSVYGVFDVTPDGRMLVHAMHRERIESGDHETWVTGLWKRYGGVYLAIENKTFGLTLVQILQRSGKIPVIPLKADTDKVSRFMPAVPLFHNDRLFIPSHASWRQDFEAEVRAFPKGKHDDQVDVIAYAVKQAATIPRRSVATGSTKSEMELFWERILSGKRGKSSSHPVLGKNATAALKNWKR